jgi:hypothetical protein
MKIELVKEEISIVMESLKEQFDMINNHETQIPQIEVDIFMRNIQKLYENTIYLNKLNSSGEQNELKKTMQSEIVETSSDIQIATDQTEEIASEIKEVEEVEEVVQLEPTMFSENPTPPFQKEIKEAKISPKEEEKTEDILFSNEKVDDFDDLIESESKNLDLFTNIKAADEITDLNKKLAEARNSHSIVEKLQNKRIENLKSVIGINDKFYFINELFNGNAQKYEDIIYTLNNFKKLEDAMQYFSTLKYRFSWDEESEAYEKLTKMLERKFNLINA